VKENSHLFKKASMLNFRFLTLLLLSILLGGCSTLTIVKIHQGPASEGVLLYVDPHVVVMKVDDSNDRPGDPSRGIVAHSAGKRREAILLSPGPHEIAARFFVLCRQSVNNSILKFNAEAGKNYRLRSTVDIKDNRWQPEIVEYLGEEIEASFSWTSAMCPPDVTIIPLRK
jgi:hypothetical protein